MDLTIHRGAREIGGICIEVAHKGTRIIIDAGTPLVDSNRRPFKGDPATVLPTVPGLFADDGTTPDALLLTHTHIDHYGLLPYVRPDVPVYAGHVTRALIELTSQFIRAEYDHRRITPVMPGMNLQIGAITATPFPVDHSALGAFAWQLQADGHRVLYSGDLRAHGLDADLFENLLRDVPKGIDALLLEGTHLMDAQTAYPSETAVLQGMVDIATATPGLVVAFASGQNIDRIKVLREAARRTGRTLVIDIYAAHVLRLLGRLPGNQDIPQAEDEGVLIFYPFRLAKNWADNGRRRDLFGFPNRRISRDELRANPGAYLMVARPSMWEDLGRLNLDGAALAWSMWSGYLAEPSARGLRNLATRRALPFHHIHTSGHAFRADLQRLVQELKPRRVVPIHTFDAARYADAFGNVVRIRDGDNLALG